MSINNSMLNLEQIIRQPFITEAIKNVQFINSFYLKSRHSLASIIGSLDDDNASQISQDLISLVAKSAERATKLQFDEDPKIPDSHFFNIFPGEHYKILAGIIQELGATKLVEIGTFTGMSTRVMLDYSCGISTIKTFDIVPWKNFNSHLKPEDFENSRCKQFLEDLSEPLIFDRYAQLFETADLIFCDAPKDGEFEYKFLKHLSQYALSPKTRYLVLDDIRFLNMAPLWRKINSPKLDLTSFGHWSGTGIVDISKGLQFKKL